MTGPGFTRRPGFFTLPTEVIDALQRELGSMVVAAADRHGGMSPGPAAVLSLADGRRVFVKASDRCVNPGSVDLYEAELDVLQLLGDEVPHARLIAGLEMGSWCAVVTEVVDGGHPGPPWSTASVDATLATIDSLGLAPRGLPPFVDRAPGLDGWRDLATTDHDGLDEWEQYRIDRLASLEEGWEDWTAGEHLVHQDVRGDNAISAADGVRLVDWSFGSRGAGWADRSWLAADIAAAGQPHGVTLAERCLRDCPPEAVRLVVALAGMWRRNSTRPDHPNLPTFRAWQRHRAVNLRPFLDRILETV